MTGLIVSRSICMGASVGPILRVVTAGPGTDIHLHGSLATAFIFGAWLFNREIVRARMNEDRRDG